MTPSYHKEYQDHSLSSFFTGAVVGSLIALTLGTEDGRKFGKNLIKTVKYLGEELQKQANNFPENTDAFRQQARSRVEDFNQGVQDLNSTVQNVGNQVINYLHRDQNNTSHFTKDGKPLS